MNTRVGITLCVFALVAGYAYAQFPGAEGVVALRDNLCQCYRADNLDDAKIDCPFPFSETITVSQNGNVLTFEGYGDVNIDPNGRVTGLSATGPDARPGQEGTVPIVTCDGSFDKDTGVFDFDQCTPLEGWIDPASTPENTIAINTCVNIEFRCTQGSTCYDGAANPADAPQTQPDDNPPPLPGSGVAFAPSVLLIVGIVAAMF